MSWNPARTLGQQEPAVLPVRDFLAMLARQRRIAVVAFALVFVFAIVYGLLLSDRYEANMEILVAQSELRRADPVLSGMANAQPIVSEQGSTADETLNSEVALLRSDDVLRQVVETCGLNRRPGLWYGAVDSLWSVASKLHMRGVMQAVSTVLPFLRRPTQAELTAKAVHRLADKLRIEIIKLSEVISVSYPSNSPQLAARVLRSLGAVYLNEHALARHPPGELKFFEKQTGLAHAALEKAEQQLVRFTQAGGVADGPAQLENALTRMSGTRAAQDRTRAQLAGTEQQIVALQRQSRQLPPRQTTVLKSSDNGVLLQQLKSSLLNLQLRRTQLLTQYQPTYPLVIQTDKQIAQARAALASAEKSQLEERTTNLDPDFELVRENLTQARVSLASLQARAASQAAELQTDEAQVRNLQKQGIEQQDLLRRQKTAADNYLLMLHKQQEVQVSEELDKQRLLNVSIVQRASVPALPVHPAWWYAMYGILLGILAGFAAAAGADRLDPTLRTPEEVEMALHAPVLVTLPLPASLSCVIDNGRKLLPHQAIGS